ncbi:hypothetical protein P7K49_035626 [Saguinus oedipus]|uniref:Uncharacterized protein n=1 Tax=Saguinus oedipus TaxID=9490 RepID=A0ABQ9TN73_SAGOE|nr:hypothetical protein P7K49_035626 [Saguinus oedipus]
MLQRNDYLFQDPRETGHNLATHRTLLNCNYPLHSHCSRLSSSEAGHHRLEDPSFHGLPEKIQKENEQGKESESSVLEAIHVLQDYYSIKTEEQEEMQGNNYKIKMKYSLVQGQIARLVLFFPIGGLCGKHALPDPQSGQEASSFIPLLEFIEAGGAGATLYVLHLALFNPGVN